MILRLLLLATLLAGCAAAPQAQAPPAPEAGWAAAMAEAVMTRRPLVRERWDYETGTVLRGFEELYAETGDETYYDYIQSNIDAYVQPDGSIETYRFDDFNLDNIKAGSALFLLDETTDDPRYRLAADLLHTQLEEQPTTSEGGYWHKQRYPYQMWMDGLYMAEPFAVDYALSYLEGEDRAYALDHAALQFLLAARTLRDPATGLYYHGWDEAKEQIWADPLTGRSQEFWGRAMGWYAMALVDVLEAFPEDHPDRGTLLDLFEDYAEAIATVQDPVSGVWWQVLDKPNREGNYLEASVSSMFTYALLKGVRLGLIDENTYLPRGERAYHGLIREFIRPGDDGMISLTKVVSVGGLGGDNDRDGTYEYYLSEPLRDDDPKGTGPFILASLEMERLGLLP